MKEAYPLSWPPAWPRTKYPKTARFDTSFSSARDATVSELNRLGAKDIVISSMAELRRDGLPYANQRVQDTGIAVYFKLNGEDQCIPCDKWTTLADNMQAIRKTVEAIRGLERWGAKEMVNAAFRGFKALPESSIVTPYQPRIWHEVLQVHPDASAEIVKAAYRQLMLKNHPDQGGSVAGFNEVKKAYNEYMSKEEL